MLTCIRREHNDRSGTRVRVSACVALDVSPGDSWTLATRWALVGSYGPTLGSKFVPRQGKTRCCHQGKPDPRQTSCTSLAAYDPYHDHEDEGVS